VGGGRWYEGMGGYKSGTPAEETCAETAANWARTSHLMQLLSSVRGGYFNSCDSMARNLQNGDQAANLRTDWSTAGIT
jgi:hypothetical protein